MATAHKAPTPAEMTTALSVAFPANAIQTKSIPGQRPLSYVAGHTYIHRLIDATGNGWDWQIKSFEPRPYGATSKGNAQLLLIVTGTLTIPGLGSRDGMGVQVVTAETGGEDMWKGAQTDALKNAARLFGVGLELYGPDYEAGEVADAPVQRQNAPERDEDREKAMKSVFALGAARGLNQDQVKQLAYKRGGTDSMTKLTVQALRLLWKHMDGGTPESLKAELAQEGAQY